jgi:hypothetical protein
MKLEAHEDLHLFYGSSGEKRDRAWMIIKPEIWRVGVQDETTFDIYLGEIRKMANADVFKMVFAFLKEKGNKQDEN